MQPFNRLQIFKRTFKFGNQRLKIILLLNHKNITVQKIKSSLFIFKYEFINLLMSRLRIYKLGFQKLVLLMNDGIYYSMLLIFLLIAIANCKLTYVATVFRHGARYPLSNIFDGNQTKQFHGRLTPVGMRQQFLLGGYLKAQYIDKAKLINSTLYPKEVQTFADSSERCVESLICHLAGLFPFGTGVRLPENINSSFLDPPFQSVAKDHLRERTDDNEQNMLGLPDFALRNGFQPVPFINATRFFPNCPHQQNIIAKRIQSQAVKLAEFQAVHAVFTQKMRIVFKLKTQFANLVGLAQLYDVVVCDLNLGRQMPAQFTSYDQLQLKYIQNYLFVFIYGGNVAPIFATSVLTGILGNMDNIIKNGAKQVKKFSIYSGHDTNVVPLLVFLNLTTPECITKKWKNQTVTGNCAECPPFASNIIFELHQNDTDTSKHYVKLRYNGDYYNLCEKSAKQCDYVQFAARCRAQFVDVAKECGFPPAKNDQPTNSEEQYEQALLE